MKVALKIQNGIIINLLNRRYNIDQYIHESLRRKCYSEWVKVRRCAIRNLGDTFAAKINMSRQIEEPQYSEDEIVDKYQSLLEDKAEILKWEKNQFGPPEEEEGEGEGEGEDEEEAAEEESTGEEASGEEATGEEVTGEEA